jgi:hypothetical protein
VPKVGKERGAAPPAAASRLTAKLVIANTAKIGGPEDLGRIARKAQGKREASKQTFAEKIVMVEALSERPAPQNSARARKWAERKSLSGLF